MKLLSFFRMFLLLSIGAFFVVACKVNKKIAEADTPDAFSEAYYQNMGNNLERLQKIQCGFFVQYREDVDEKTFAVWSFNDSEDSMVLYVMPAGDLNKDGYWLYCHQFISGLPDAPVYSAFVKLTALNRDTFVAQYYQVPQNYTWEQVKKKEPAAAKLEALEQSQELVYFTKVSNSHFVGQSEPYKNPVPNEPAYRQDTYTITPDRVVFHPRFYEDLSDRKKILISGVKEHLLRLKNGSSPFMK